MDQKHIESRGPLVSTESHPPFGSWQPDTPSWPAPPASEAVADGAPSWVQPTPPGGWSGTPAVHVPAVVPAGPTPAPNPYGAPVYSAPVQPVPGAPVYGVPPLGAPAYAPVPVKAPSNGWAVAAFVSAVVMLAVGLLSGFYIGSIFVVIMARQGISQAKKLDAAGYGPKGRALAWWGAGIGLANLVIVAILRTRTG